jgi:hypothetical protein
MCFNAVKGQALAGQELLRKAERAKIDVLGCPYSLFDESSAIMFGLWLRFLVSLVHETNRRTTHRPRKLSGHHHSKFLQSGRSHRSFVGDAYRMDRERGRANERTSRQNFGVLKGEYRERVADRSWTCATRTGWLFSGKSRNNSG